MTRAVYGFMKTDVANDSYMHFKEGEPIEVLGLLYNRGSWRVGQRVRPRPDMYLARKHIKGDRSFAAIPEVVERMATRDYKYESYNGVPLSKYIDERKDFTWVYKEEMDIDVPPSVLAKTKLERWDD